MRNPLQCRTIFFKVKSIIFFAGRTLCGPKGALPIVADDCATRHASENFFCPCAVVAGNCALCLLHVCVLLDHLKYKYALGIQISFMLYVGWRQHLTSFNSSSPARRPAQMRKQRFLKNHSCLITDMATPWILQSFSGISLYFGFYGCRKTV